MRTPQLTEQYGQVDRVSVARAIFNSFSCATAGVRSKPRREKPAPPTSAPLRKVLRESSIAHPPTNVQSPAGLHPKFPQTIIPLAHHSQRRVEQPNTTEARRHGEEKRKKNSPEDFLCVSVVKA